MQTISSWIWTYVAGFIPYDSYYHTTNFFIYITDSVYKLGVSGQ